VDQPVVGARVVLEARVERACSSAAWATAIRLMRDWRREMSAADAARFDTVAGDALAELGY
jgi:hypothetical protein